MVERARNEIRRRSGALMLAAALLCAVGLVAPAGAAKDVGIIAIVNDAVITEFDVQQRIGLIALSSGTDPRSIDPARLRPQVLRTLIDEVLKMQEAKRLEIDVSKDEIEDAKADIAQRNNVSFQTIEQQLTARGVSVATLDRQIEADIAWNKLLSGRFASRVAISDDQIDLAIRDLELRANEPQYRVSEIFLAVDSPTQEAEAERAAQALLSQVRSGVPFPELARQFSQAVSSVNGGDLGWVRRDQVPEDIGSALDQMRPGSISEPIRSTGGIYIIALRDRRVLATGEGTKTSLDLKQLFYPMDSRAPVAQALKVSGDISKALTQLKGCESFPELAKLVNGSQVIDMGDVDPRSLPEELRPVLASLREGDVTRPIRSNEGFHVFAVCKRAVAEFRMPSRREIEEQIKNQEVGSLARRYLRDLRNDAVVEYR